MARKKDESAGKPRAQPDLPLADDPALQKVPDPDWYVGDVEDGEDELRPTEDGPLNVGEFHQIAQKQIMNAVFAVLAETKMDWNLVEPLLAAARDVLLGDIEETAQVRLHTVQQGENGDWVEAEEAYLGISVSDREEGEEWLSDTWWLSEIAIAEDDPEQVRAIVRALERSIAKLNAWLADKARAPSASTASE